MQRKEKNKISFVIVILSVLFFCTGIPFSGQLNRMKTVKAQAQASSDQIIQNEQLIHADTAELTRLSAAESSESTTEDFTLYSRNPEENIAFEVANMFPGDTVTKNFRVKISYKDDITLYFRTEIDSSIDGLADVLKLRVVLPELNEVLYDGLMQAMPQEISHTLKTDTLTTSEVLYEITAYLDTSVGNDYMQNALKADFIWQVNDSSHLASTESGKDTSLSPYSPETGINVELLSIYTGIALILVSLLLYGLLRKKSDKEERHES